MTAACSEEWKVPSYGARGLIARTRVRTISVWHRVLSVRWLLCNASWTSLVLEKECCCNVRSRHGLFRKSTRGGL